MTVIEQFICIVNQTSHCYNFIYFNDKYFNDKASMMTLPQIVIFNLIDNMYHKFNPYSVGIDFSQQNLMSIDVRI